MIALFIIGGILILLLLLFSLRVGVQIGFGEALTIKARIGPHSVLLLPKKKTEEKKEKKPVKEQKKEEKQGKKKLDLTPADIRSAIPAVWESLQRTLRKSRQKIRIDPLTL